MRTITVDFTSQSYPVWAGYIGEHNATTVTVLKPNDLAGASYSLAFMTNGEVIHSKFYDADEEIEVTLWQQLTQDNSLYVQLEAYDENGDYLGKSTVAKLVLSNSVHGIDMVADADNPDVYSEIAQNSVFRETLKDNVDTLDKLTTSQEGKLLFDGKLIEGTGGVSGTLDVEVKTDTEDEYVLEFVTDSDTITTPNLKGKQGVSGVYVGSGDMPEGYNVQIDPEGEATEGGGLTEEQLAEFEANTEARHTHENKAVLDVLTPEVMAVFDETVSKRHEHSNKDTLDNIDSLFVKKTELDTIPDYVKAEAENVIHRVIAAQGNRTFTFACISDLHYGNASYTDGVKHACQAMKYIDERIKLDAVAVLGDYTDGYPAEGFENAIDDFKTINSVLADLRFAPNLRTQGNHDYYADHTALVNRFIQSYSDNVVWGSKSGGYFYRDFEEFKLRIICVNTTETGNANIGCSTEQYQWFVNSLDLTAKDDVAEWQILVLSHHPLDWYTTDSTYRFAYFLDGYKNGTSGTAGGIAYDFTNKNSATLICNIHGHIHNLLTDFINKGNINTANPTTVMRMCTPEACINRANQYDGWKEDADYKKTVNTADDTSFVVYCVNLDENTITAVCYGAGYDRKINYLGEALTYTITNNLTNVTTDNTDLVVDENTEYTANLTATQGSIVSVVVTMGGVDITSTAYADGVINIASVTGDIVITAGAREEQPETSYTNWVTASIDTDGSVYNNGVGYKNGYRLDSSGGEKACSNTSVTGFIPIKQQYTVRLENIALTVGINSENQFIRVYDSDFACIGGFKTSQWGEWLCADVTTDSTTRYVTSFRLTNGLGDNPAYFRISANTFDSTAVITVHEPTE